MTRIPEDEASCPRDGGIKLIHVAVIALSLLMTFSAWQFAHDQTQTRVSARFEAERDRVIGLISDRMQRYENLLWSGAAAVESHGGAITKDQWRVFARNLGIGETYQGINGIAVIHHLDDGALPGYLADRKAETPDFAIRPAHGEDIHLPVSFIEPEGPNAKALGFDLANETNRREGALASRDSGEARITAPITLVQDAGRTPGFLFYVPVYRGERPDTVEARRERIVGFVNAAFIVRNLMEGLLAEDLRGVRFSIADGGQTIYDEHSADDPLTDPDPMFAETASLDLYGRNWTLDIRSNLAFRDQNVYVQPTLILIGGLVIEALIVTLLLLMARANRKAVAYGDALTAALRLESLKLREANDELSLTNRELEQFAYVTSHDLRTPIRGIGGLTEMVEDDLAGYFASPDADPDVRVNLGRIQERVRRMNDLTTGIMEFSRSGGFDAEADALFLPDTVTGLASDLGLADGQLVLTGGVERIETDPLNFRRVLENLVGNAVKHHPDPASARIVVSVTDGSALRVAVSDNGDGIDAAYHDRIFGMFQTLREGDAPESTGIGLAIVKKAVERHGGTVRVERAEGGGATFLFDWPRRGRTTLPRSEAA